MADSLREGYHRWRLVTFHDVVAGEEITRRWRCSYCQEQAEVDSLLARDGCLGVLMVKFHDDQSPPLDRLV